MQKLVKMVKEEHDVVVQELNMSSNQLVTERTSMDTIEASLMVTSACLTKSIAEFHCLLAKARGQRERDLVRVQMVLGKAEARATKVEKVVDKVEAKGIKADMRIASIETKVMKAKVRAWAVKQTLCEAKDQALAMKEEVLAVKALVSKIAAKVVEAFKAREE